ncbi:MAG: peptide deformylase [Acidobacteriota bacterium]
MPLQPIVRLGHPALRAPAQPVDLETLQQPEMRRLIDDMLETMIDADGVGLAAPQLGIEQQIFVYAAIGEEQTGEAEAEHRVLINPGVDPEPGEPVYDWEGCLSIPDLRGLVPRHHAVRVTGFDRHGQAVSFRAEGYEARILQHEFDHLNGITFVDRMRDLRSLCFGAEWEEFMTEPGER